MTSRSESVEGFWSASVKTKATSTTKTTTAPHLNVFAVFKRVFITL